MTERNVEDHPYSDAITASGLVFVSGALPLKPDGTIVGGRMEALNAAIDTAQNRLATVGSHVEDAVKVTYFLTDISMRHEANIQFSDIWQSPRPARTVVEVSGLPYGANVEIDVIAQAR